MTQLRSTINFQMCLIEHVDLAHLVSSIIHVLFRAFRSQALLRRTG